MSYRVHQNLNLYRALFMCIVPLFISGQTVTAELGMVASAHPLATKAGVEILKMGGNAADAALAVAFSLGVVEPNASGLGGGGFLLYSNAKKDKVTMLDFRETAPAKFEVSKLYGEEGNDFLTKTSSIMAVGVPGTVSGLLTLHEQEGILDIEDVLQPAIKYAREGFIVSEKFADMIMSNFEKIVMNPATAKHFLIDGLPAMEGELIKNEALARCYEEIVKEGTKGFYTGKISNSILGTVQGNGGVLLAGDLKGYKAQKKVPTSGSYRGFEIFSAPAPAGGTQIIQLLNILEKYDLSKYRPGDAAYLHLIAEAMKMVYVDKSAVMGDPDFVDVPVDRLLSKSYAEYQSKLIDPAKASFDYQYSLPFEEESGSTTHFSIIDEEGNMLALTQSVNHWFGTGISDDEYGILLNDHLKDFAKDVNSPNALEAGKRPVSSIAPTLILKDNTPFLSIGTPGASRIISALAQIIVNVIDFKMDIDEAIEAPRIHAIGDKLYVENRFPETTLDTLKTYGHQLVIKGAYDNYFGGAQAIMRDSIDATLRGGADSRRDGNALGY